MRDSYHSLALRPVIVPIVVSDNTAAVGTVIDRLGFESLTYAILTGTLADADATFAVLLEESDEDDTGFTAVVDTDLIGTEAAAGFTFADDGETRKIGYVGSKRFTRLTITPTGNAGSAPIAAMAILADAHDRPTV